MLKFTTTLSSSAYPTPKDLQKLQRDALAQTLTMFHPTATGSSSLLQLSETHHHIHLFIILVTPVAVHTNDLPSDVFPQPQAPPLPVHVWVRGVEEVPVGGVGVGAGGWVCRTCKHQPIFHLDPKILELLLCMYFKGLPQEIKQNYHGFPLVF